MTVAELIANLKLVANQQARVVVGTDEYVFSDIDIKDFDKFVRVIGYDGEDKTQSIDCGI